MLGIHVSHTAKINFNKQITLNYNVGCLSHTHYLSHDSSHDCGNYVVSLLYKFVIQYMYT